MSDINNIQINDVNYAILDEELTDINAEITDVKSDLTQLDSDLDAEVARAEAEEARIEALFTQPVEEAVSDWLDDHPEATTTVQDGSLTEAKFTTALKEKVINEYVTPQMYGAIGNGTADDTQAIQDAIDSGKNVVFPVGTYKITDTIYIGSSARRVNFTFDASNTWINYTGNGNAFYLTDIRNCTLKFGYISASSGSCIKLYSADSSHPIQYVDISFKIMDSLNDCINAEQHDGGWINEVRIKDGRFQSGTNGVYISEDADVYAMDGWKFEDIAVEGVTNGFNLNATSKGMRYFLWTGCRYQENHTYVIKTVGSVYSCLFIGQHDFKPEKYSFSNDTTNFLFITAYNDVYPAFNTIILHGTPYRYSNIFNMLGGGIKVESNSDFDDLYTAGNYYVESNAIAETIDNIPLTKAGKLTVEYIGNFYSANYRYFTQIYTSYTGIVYLRKGEYSNGTVTYGLWSEFDYKKDSDTTFTAGTKVTASVNRVTKSQRIVLLEFRIVATDANTNQDVLLTVPEGYRPVNDLYIYGVDTSSKMPVIMILGKNGKVNLFGGASTFDTTNGNIICSITYIS